MVHTRRTLLTASTLSVGLGAAIAALPVLAQLSSPMPGVAPVQPGKGAGYHDPRSQYAPLKDRRDAIPWAMLTSVKTKKVGKRLLPDYPDVIQKLDKKTWRIQGYMKALTPSRSQTNFLLMSVPPSCPFCVAGGPESMVEVLAPKGVPLSDEPVVMQGTLHILSDDPYGLYYRLVDAVVVK